MWTRRAVAAFTAVAATMGCGSDTTSDKDVAVQDEDSETPCFEWQRFMRHAGTGTTDVTVGPGSGEVVFSGIGFVHGGSWELNFVLGDGTDSDEVQLLLCVAGVLPFADCYRGGAENDAGCAEAVDVRCRGDEQLAGEVVQSTGGIFEVEIVGIEPSPPNDQEPTTMTLRVSRSGGEPLGDAEIDKAVCRQ